VENECVLMAELIECKSNKEIYKGIKAGGQVIVAKGSRVATLCGLKLARLGQVRDSLEKLNNDSKEFKIKISIKIDGDADEVVTTTSFTLVSSFTQLPTDLQEIRTTRTGKKYVKKR
jgi:hypothetical protein